MIIEPRAERSRLADLALTTALSSALRTPLGTRCYKDFRRRGARALTFGIRLSSQRATRVLKQNPLAVLIVTRSSAHAAES
jgi:hypothetical protein